MNAPSDTRIAAWLAFLLFGVFLLSFGGQLYSQDSMSMFSVTESVVKRLDLSTDQMWTLFKARAEIASDGESYAKYGYGTSLFAIPLYGLALALPGLGLVQTTLLTSSVVIALAGALVFLAARRLSYSTGTALAVALLFGLATPAWVYAKQLWSEPFALFTLFAAFYFLLSFRQEPKVAAAVLAGIALGLAVATRVTNAALVPLLAWYGFGRVRDDGRVRTGLLWFTAMLALAAFSIVAYDMVRYGSPLATGYRADEQFDNPLLLGLYGLLFSPGKGLFIYTPFLAVLPFTSAVFYRRARAEVLLILACTVVYLLTFSTWYYWWGGTNWGPRFLVPLLPFLVLLTAPAVELAARAVAGRAHMALAAIFSFLCLVSFGIQILGVSIPSLAYRLRMLRLSPNPEADAIFLPAFSPLVGYFDLFRPKLIDFAWIRGDGGSVTVDGLAVGLALALILFCAGSLYAAVRGGRDGARASHPRMPAAAGLLAALVFVAAIALFSLYRYREDVRFGGGDGYRALLQQVEREERAGDVLILNNDVLAPFLFNENRARLRWYGLSRDPGQWDEATRRLLTRISGSYRRIWLATDDSTAGLPDPVQDWLAQSLAQVERYDFDQGVHLVLFAGSAGP